MEAAALAIATKVGPPLIQLFGNLLASQLKPGVESRLRRAVAEAVLAAAATRGYPRWRLDKAIQARWNRGRIAKRIRTDAVAYERRADDPESDRLSSATRSWRDELAAAIAEVAAEGLRDDPDRWGPIVGDASVEDWGERVEGALVWQMTKDPALQPILAQLNWGSEQTAREASAYATLSYLRGMRIVLRLTSGILVSLVAIAVILAVD